MLGNILLANSLSRFLKFYQSQRLAKLITTILFMVLFIVVAVALYFFFLNGFAYINNDPTFRLPLTLYSYELFLLILSGIIIFSAFITGLFSLFRGSDDHWILSTPNYQALPQFIFLKTIASSSWPLLVVFIPALVALNKLNLLPWYGIIVSLVSFVLLTIALTALALIFIIAISLLYDWLAAKSKLFYLSFRGIVLTSLAIILVAIIFIRLSTDNTDLIRMFRAQDIGASVSTELIAEHFAYLPTHSLAMQLLAWQSQAGGDALAWALILLLIAIVLTGVWRLAAKKYLYLWQKLQEGNFTADPGLPAVKERKTFFEFRGGQLSTIFKKEALMSVRNTKNLLWFFFLLAILVMQMGVYRMLGHNISEYQLDIDKNVALIQALQFATAIYFICAFTLRFVFTSFSTERRTAWILSSAPLKQERIYFGKFSFYALVFSLVGCLIWFINSSLFELPFLYVGYSFVIFLIATGFVLTLGYSLGAMFPNYETNDPGAISTTLPGIGFILLSLIYSALGGWLLYLMLITNTSIFIFLFALVSFITIIALLITVPKKIQGRDIL